MNDPKLYWTIMVALVSAGWAITSFFRDRASQAVERTGAIMDRLLEGDKLSVENPDILKYLAEHAGGDPTFFRDPSLLGDALFFKAKTYVYRQLNSFDEILSFSSQASVAWSFLKPPALIELSDWEAYIKERLRHPLYRSILHHEAHIFGSALRQFWDRHRGEIESRAVDPFVW
jgi:hypothetical protein